MLKPTANKLTSTLSELNIPILNHEELADSSVASTFRSISSQLPAFSYSDKKNVDRIRSGYCKNNLRNECLRNDVNAYKYIYIYIYIYLFIHDCL